MGKGLRRPGQQSGSEIGVRAQNSPLLEEEDSARGVTPGPCLSWVDLGSLSAPKSPSCEGIQDCSIALPWLP